MTRLARSIRSSHPHHVRSAFIGTSRPAFVPPTISRIANVLPGVAPRARLKWGRSDDGLTEADPVLLCMPDRPSPIDSGQNEALSMVLSRAKSTGRPLGTNDFSDMLKALTGRNPRQRRGGPNPRDFGDA